jgi:hypothetical protein
MARAVADCTVVVRGQQGCGAVGGPAGAPVWSIPHLVTARMARMVAPGLVIGDF